MKYGNYTTQLNKSGVSVQVHSLTFGENEYKFKKPLRYNFRNPQYGHQDYIFKDEKLGFGFVFESFTDMMKLFSELYSNKITKLNDIEEMSISNEQRKQRNYMNNMLVE